MGKFVAPPKSRRCHNLSVNNKARHLPASGLLIKRVKGVESDSNPLVSSENDQISDAGAAKASVAVSPPMSANVDLHTVIDSWPHLPDALKAGIVVMVKAARKE
jgi:hypothetical protein